MIDIKYDIIGKIFSSNSCGNFIVLGRIFYLPEDYEPKYARYAIKFLNTGCITDASYDAIRHGRVRDFMKPSVAGIGFVGSEILVSDPEFLELYKAWNDMINRCYNPTDGDYPLYGGLGIKVDPRWFNFTVFATDAHFLPLYEKKEKYPMLYQLDKDYKQLHIPKSQRVYSPETCMWLSTFDNSIVMTRDKETSSGYYGVTFKDGSWATRVNNAVYGRFTTPEAAANLYNYVYTKLRHEFNDILLLNNVPYIPFDELKNYCVGSTTIRGIGVGSKWTRSGSASLYQIPNYNVNEELYTDIKE